MKKVDIKQLLSQADNLPALPHTVAKLLEELNDPNVDLGKISREIALDQSISAKILRLVNSSFYGMPGRIGDLRQAVVVLGLETVKNVILSVSIVKAFASIKSSDAPFTLEFFWHHTVGTGLITQILARRQGLIEKNDAFVAGLLHDIGKLLLLWVSPEDFARILEAVHNEDLFFWEAEEKYVIGNHAVIGGWLAEKWRLPEHITQAILFHHSPEKADHPFAGLVHVADSLCIAFGIGAGGTSLVPPISEEVWTSLKIDEQDLPELFEEISASLESVSRTASILLD